MTFEQTIESALREYGCSDSNPCGGTGYHEPEQAKPYRVLFCDGAESESFATEAEAIAAAAAYADQMDAERDSEEIAPGIYEAGDGTVFVG